MPNFRLLLPTIRQLTDDQKQALLCKTPIIVTGGPGSGKTVVSVLRLRRQVAEGNNVLFFTYNRTLMAAIRGIARAQEFNPLLINSFYEWYYDTTGAFIKNATTDDIHKNLITLSSKRRIYLDEIIVDEAQDLGPEIIGNLNEISRAVSCGADRDQDINKRYEGDPETKIRALLNNKHQYATHYILRTNYRNTRQLFEFARSFVPNNPRPQMLDLGDLQDGNRPEIYYHLSYEQQLAKILEVVLLNMEANIGILVHRTSQVDHIRHYLTQHGIRCSYYYSYQMSVLDRIQMEANLQTPFITTLNSCKGLEFDIVIMPLFETSDWFVRHKYTNENHYYVAATRAKRQLFIFCEYLPSILQHFQQNLYRHNGDAPAFQF